MRIEREVRAVNGVYGRRSG